MSKAPQAKRLWSATQARSHKPKPTVANDYSLFDQLDGRHPFSNAVPIACVHYQVRILNDGKVTYFNFNLAKEMGLIPKNHNHRLNKTLEQKILETFSIQIINEYDLYKNRKFENVKTHPYMATRYLQLQHKNRKGQTSGDGRSIWNGIFTNKGKTWDVNSRGTGVTCLAPGFVQAGRPLKTGGTEFGYGCGTADIDELVSAAIMSEIYHRKGINTERVLAIIDLGNGIGIGVRASLNLFRPAHLFALLKQRKRKELARALDFMIERQVVNGKWKIHGKRSHRLDESLHYLAKNFARFAARIEADYMFVWLDWDGDNVLFDPGIIDYGSVRQFGMFHDSYKYDDVDRYSTTILQQQKKAKEITQTFCQLIHYVRTGRILPISRLKSHWSTKLFEREFNHYRLERFLLNLGFDAKTATRLLNDKFDSCSELFSINRYFETRKTKRRTERLPDGLIKPAIFNLRKVWREYPRCLLENELLPLEVPEFFEILLSDTAKGTDLRFKKAYIKKIERYQEIYMELVEACPDDWSATLAKLAKNSALVSPAERITGNSVECITEEILLAQKRGLSQGDLQKVMESIIQQQSPESKDGASLILFESQQSRSLLEKAFRHIRTYQEDI